jgi:DNA-binding MarR family transcriptional regulator
VLRAFGQFQTRLMTVHAIELSSIELTMAQAKLLYLVAATGGLSLSEIAGRLGISLSTASGAVDRLVDLGLLDRATVPSNRRQVQVSVTPAGIEALEQFHELSERQMRAFLERVDEADLALIERALDVLAAAIPDSPDLAVPAIEAEDPAEDPRESNPTVDPRRSNPPSGSPALVESNDPAATRPPNTSPGSAS